MAQENLSDGRVRELLLAVGASPDVGTGDFGSSFDDLGLDSLARTEMASRIKDELGVDIEDELTAELTPSGMRELVGRSLLPAGGTGRTT
ncbi:MAG TPA: acyl carrier protein [Pseudonocardiaceae bacterium]|jgi:acyl carrier protein|nr:acyl carrier protein [Pseudonocardiaceae bacterium]